MGGSIKTRDMDNIQVGHGYVGALSHGDVTTVGALLADDVVWHQPGTSHLSGIDGGKPNVFQHRARSWR